MSFLLLAGAGISVSAYSLWRLWTVLARRRWPNTLARIFYYEAETVAAAVNFWFYSGFIRRQTGQKVKPLERLVESRLCYEFVVDGERFIGDSLYSAPLNLVRSNRISNLKAGEKVRVFYNSSNPQDSFLAHSFAWPSVIALVAGTLLIGMSLML